MRTKLASPGQRLVAKGIDCLLVALPILIGIYLWIAARGPNGPEDVNTTYLLYGVVFAAGTLLLTVVQWVLIAVRGQSIGKIVLKIQIVDAKSRKVGSVMQNLVLRTWINDLLSLSCLYLLVDSLLIFREEHQTIHDFIAHTKVIRQK